MTDYTKLIEDLRLEGREYKGNIIDDEDKQMLLDAAAALEAAEKQIAELEAQMPKQGEWIVDTNGYPQIICSICDVHIPMVAGWCMDAHINYCPNCGAKMRGEQE